MCDHTTPRYGPVAGLLLRAYKATLSPLFVVCGVQCRHFPTCSEYMAEAITRHGFWPGGWMGFARFCRCRPGGSHGMDQVMVAPPTTARWWTPWRYGDWRGPQG